MDQDPKAHVKNDTLRAFAIKLSQACTSSNRSVIYPDEKKKIVSRLNDHRKDSEFRIMTYGFSGMTVKELSETARAAFGNDAVISHDSITLPIKLFIPLRDELEAITQQRQVIAPVAPKIDHVPQPAVFDNLKQLLSLEGRRAFNEYRSDIRAESELKASHTTKVDGHDVTHEEWRVGKQFTMPRDVEILNEQMDEVVKAIITAQRLWNPTNVRAPKREGPIETIIVKSDTVRSALIDERQQLQAQLEHVPEWRKREFSSAAPVLEWMDKAITALDESVIRAEKAACLAAEPTVQRM